MKHRGIAVLLAIAVANVGAAGARFDVKGVPLGVTEAQANELVGDLKCTDVPERFQRVTLTGRSCTSESSGHSFAGIDAAVQYWMDGQGRVAGVTVGVILPSQFEDLLAAMQTKYGKPQIEKSTLANRMGARFENVMAHWKSPGGDHIVLERYNTLLDDPLSAGQLRFYSAELWQRRVAGAASRREDAKRDM